MGICYSGDYIAGEIYRENNIKTYNTEELQHMFRLGRIRNKLLEVGGGCFKLVLLDPSRTLRLHNGSSHLKQLLPTQQTNESITFGQ